MKFLGASTLVLAVLVGMIGFASGDVSVMSADDVRLSAIVGGDDCCWATDFRQCIDCVCGGSWTSCATPGEGTCKSLPGGCYYKDLGCQGPCPGNRYCSFSV